MRVAEAVVMGFLVLFLLVLGAYSQWPSTITHDAAIHAEKVVIVGLQGFPRSWEPYAVNGYTYPPLFHYLAFLLPLKPIDAVRALGIVIFALFPVAVYYLVSTYNKRAALIAALFIGLLPAFATIAIYGEFPQLLAMFLFVWEWYLLRKGKFGFAGVFCGLAVLSHVFIALAAVIVYFYYLFWAKKGIFYYVAPFITAVPWIPNYVRITINALTGKWENVVYNASQPVLGFWSSKQILEWLFGTSGFGPLVLLLAVIGLFFVKERLVKGLFLFCLAFTVFHLPLTQLKIYDLLALPTIILSSIGIINLKLKEKHLKALLIFIVGILAVLQVQHFINAKENWLNKEVAPDEQLVDAAEWLSGYDNEFVRIYSYKATAWTGILANKMPIEPEVTKLEVYSEGYRKQIAVNNLIKEKLEKGEDVKGLLDEYNIKYVLIPNEIKIKNGNLSLIYGNMGWDVYQN